MRPCIVLKSVYNQATYSKTDHWFTLFYWNYWPVALYRKSWEIEEEPGNHLHGSKPENKKKGFQKDYNLDISNDARWKRLTSWPTSKKTHFLVSRG